MSQETTLDSDPQPGPAADTELEKQRRVADKLAGIADSGFSVITETYRAGSRHVPTDFYTVTAWPAPDEPLQPGLRFHAEKGGSDILVWQADIGDEELEGHGLGALMLTQVVQYHHDCLRPPVKVRRLAGKSKPPKPLTLSRQRGNLAFMHALDKAAGRENISFTYEGVRYGHGEELPFEAVLGRQAVHGRHDSGDGADEFAVHDVKALIVPERFLSVDIPIRLRQIAAAARYRLEAMGGTQDDDDPAAETSAQPAS